MTNLADLPRDLVFLDQAISDAIAMRRLDLFQAAIPEGVVARGENSHGFCALNECVIRELDEFAEFLVTRRKASPNQQDAQGRTPFLWAVRNQNERLTRLFLPLANLLSKDQNGAGALSLAAKSNWAQGVALLLAAGCSWEPNLGEMDPMLIASVWSPKIMDVLGAWALRQPEPESDEQKAQRQSWIQTAASAAGRSPKSFPLFAVAREAAQLANAIQGAGPLEKASGLAQERGEARPRRL